MVDSGQLVMGWANSFQRMREAHAVLMEQRMAEGLPGLMASLFVVASRRCVAVGWDARRRYQDRCGLQL